MRIGVILPNWVGDVVMATPALRALRKMAGPEGELIGIMRPYVADVLAGTEWFDRQVYYDKSRGWFRSTNRPVFRELRALQIDRMLLLTNSLRTAWLAWRSGARERIGFKNEARSLLLTKRVQQPLAFDGGTVPTVDGYLLLAQEAGCAEERRSWNSPQRLAKNSLPTRHGTSSACRAAIGSLCSIPAARTAPRSSGRSNTSLNLARRVSRDGEYSVLVNCGPAERDIAREIARQANSPHVVSLADCEALPVGLTKACIRRSRLLVTTDSGPRYFGIAFNRPVVTLFGPTDPLRTQLPYEREATLSLSLDCQPCMARVCPLGHHRCMRDLSVDMVHNAVKHALERSEHESAA